jgi:hypothetical protein
LIFTNNISFFESLLENEKDHPDFYSSKFILELQKFDLRLQEASQKIFSALRADTGRLNFINDNQICLLFEYKMNQTVILSP